MCTRLTKTDVDLLMKRDKLRKQLKAIELDLKPRIGLLCTDLNGTTRQLGICNIKFEQISSTSVAWKKLAEELLSPKKIASVKDTFTTPKIANRITIL